MGVAKDFKNVMVSDGGGRGGDSANSNNSNKQSASANSGATSFLSNLKKYQGSLLADTARVAAPFIKVDIGGYSFGVYLQQVKRLKNNGT